MSFITLKSKDNTGIASFSLKEPPKGSLDPKVNTFLEIAGPDFLVYGFEESGFEKWKEKTHKFYV